jgi:hypothetical protein
MIGKEGKQHNQLFLDCINSFNNIREALMVKCDKCGEIYCVACGGYYTVTEGRCSCNLAHALKQYKEHDSFYCVRVINKKREGLE